MGAGLVGGPPRGRPSTLETKGPEPEPSALQPRRTEDAGIGPSRSEASCPSDHPCGSSEGSLRFVPRHGRCSDRSENHEELCFREARLLRAGRFGSCRSRERPGPGLPFLGNQTLQLDRLRGLLSLEGCTRESRENHTGLAPFLDFGAPSPGRASEGFCPLGASSHLTESRRHFKDHTEKLLSEARPHLVGFPFASPRQVAHLLLF